MDDHHPFRVTAWLGIQFPGLAVLIVGGHGQHGAVDPGLAAGNLLFTSPFIVHDSILDAPPAARLHDGSELIETGRLQLMDNRSFRRRADVGHPIRIGVADKTVEFLRLGARGQDNHQDKQG